MGTYQKYIREGEERKENKREIIKESPVLGAVLIRPA